MTRLLGIVHMNPEKDPSTWDHTDVRKPRTVFKVRRIVVLMIPWFVVPQEDIYGIGAVRTPEKFYEVFGIDVTKKKTERHLCSFVESGQMHNQFVKLIRKDGMGVDYSKINYKFKDPTPIEK